jgi:hypothetical protein
MKNTVQIYGLPRSGTNFLEWSIMNNFHDIVYRNYIETTEIKEIPRNKVSVKHQLPSYKYSDKIIVIYKKWDEFIKSYKKWANKEISRDAYDTYIKKAKSMNPKRTIIFEHSWLVENYEQGMRTVAEKFNLKIKDKIIQPNRRLDKGGAKCKQSKQVYKK